MKELKLKTTIKCSGCVANVTPFLDEAAGKDNWSVDLANPAKILTVKGNVGKDKVVEAVKKAGYKAEEL
jgi:copper chaperone